MNKYKNDDGYGDYLYEVAKDKKRDEQQLKDDPGYDAWTLDYYRESVVCMEKDTLWEEIYESE